MSEIKWDHDCTQCDYVVKCKLFTLKEELEREPNKFLVLSENFISDIVTSIERECDENG